MVQKLFLTAVLVLAVAGCSGNGTDNGGAAKTAEADQGATMAETRTTPAPGPAETAEAQSPKEEGQEVALQAAPSAESKGEAPAETPAAASEKPAAPATSPPEASKQDAEMAKAEALRRAGATGNNTKPAVDTSQLQAAPDWKLTDLNGNQVELADYRGQVVLLDFWATWCGPCRMSIPHLKDLYSEYKDKGLAVVGISLDQQGPAVVRPFVQQQQIAYPIVMGNLQVTQDFGGIRGIPTAFVISQDGKIYKKYVGLVPKQVYEKDIRALLGLTS